MIGVKRICVFIAAACLLAVMPLSAAAPEENRPSLPTSTRSPLLRQVERSIARGVKYLLDNQNSDGSWGEKDSRYQVGQTSLIALSLLSCGESHQSPKLAKTITWLKTHHSPMTYNVSLHACVFASLPEAVRGEELKNDVRRLLALPETKQGPTEGMYGYGPRELNRQIGWPGDFSNTQYGAMGVWYASMTPGLEIPGIYWERQERCWRRGQNDDGGWGYQQPDTDFRGRRLRGDSYASMTAAGAATLFITNDHVHLAEAQDLSVPVRNTPVERAVAWLGENFAVDRNAGLDPPPGNDEDMGEGARRGGRWVHYMLFGYERVGEASGLTKFGTHRWYEEGARFLVRTQEDDGSWIGTNPEYLGVETAYSLLFLSRGRAPVPIQKLKFGERWNNRPRDVASFIRFMRAASERHVNWQIVDADAPGNTTAAELREAPMLYLSGDRPIALSDEQKKSLKTYVDEGGLLVFVNEGQADAFARSAEALCKALWPAYAFRDLPANHPVRQGNFPTNTWTDPIRGLSNGVRELAILFPSGDASWKWQSASGATAINQSPYAPLGNLLLYVTDKANPRYKGEATWIDRDNALPADAAGTKISVARLKHAGNWDPEPLGWTRLANILHNASDAQLVVNAADIDPSQLKSGYQLAHLTATSQLKLTDPQQKALKGWLDKGGLLLFDAAGGSPEATVSFDALMAQLYPQATSTTLPPDHAIYTASFDGIEAAEHRIESVSYRSGSDDRRLPPTKLPRLRGFTIDGRLVAIESPQDITAALVGYGTGGITGYTPRSAVELMRNIVHFAATRPASPVKK
jgi:hypothetical protein